MRISVGIRQLVVVLGLAILMGACDGGNRSTPTSPTPVGAGPSYTLSGVVSAVTPTGQAPVAGVLLVEANLGRRATTDDNGFYSLSGMYPISNSVTASKAGYATDTRKLTISRDTQLDIQLVRRAVYTLSGVVSVGTPTGPMPLEGVNVDELSCDPDSPACFPYLTQVTTTDQKGFYSMSGLYAGDHFIWLSKEGFQDNTQIPTGDGGHLVTLNADTRFDVQLVRQ